MAADAPLRVPWSAAALVLVDGLRVLSLCMALFLPELGGRFGQSAYALAFREYVDVPAQVVDLPPLYAYEVRVPGHPPRRVHARYTLGGVEGEAVGVIDEVPLDGRVTARVPLRRPDLAMAFVGEAPPGDSRVVRAAWLVGLLFGGWVLTLAGNFRLLRVLRRGRLLPARCSRLWRSRGTSMVRIIVRTPAGVLTAHRRMSGAAERALLADPVVVWDGASVFAPHEVAGLKRAPDGGGVLPASWVRLAGGALCLALLGLAAVWALAASRVLGP